ncbi:hypothetical protein BSL78_22369, partial [Apostichopus japonicus]
SEYYPVDATTGEVSTAAPSVTPTVTTSLIEVWCQIIIGVAVFILVVLAVLVIAGILVKLVKWIRKGGCTGSPGVTGDTVFYEAVDSKVTTTFVREKNSTVPVQPSEESNQAE